MRCHQDHAISAVEGDPATCGGSRIGFPGARVGVLMHDAEIVRPEHGRKGAGPDRNSDRGGNLYAEILKRYRTFGDVVQAAPRARPDGQGLAVRARNLPKDLVARTVPVQSRAGREAQPRESVDPSIASAGQVHVARCVDGRLDSQRVIGPAVTLGAIVGH